MARNFSTRAKCILFSDLDSILSLFLVSWTKSNTLILSVLSPGLIPVQSLSPSPSTLVLLCGLKHWRTLLETNGAVSEKVPMFSNV